MGRRILITRIGWFLSHRLARRLEEDPDVEYILGVDLAPPAGDLQRTEYLQVDLRKPVLLKIIESTGIDTVVHLNLYSTPGEAGGRGAMHDLNVIGAMQLFAAIQRSETVKQLIVRSSTAVYGADPNDPAVFTEDMMRSSRTDPFGRDSQEIETYARELARRRRDIEMTTFRFANILGPGADTPLANYLMMPVVPTILGFDPRLQFLHEDDATDLLVQALERPVGGVFNASGDGVMYLSQVIRQGGRLELPMPLPVLSAAAPFLRLAGRGLSIPPHVVRLIHWGRVADTRRLRETFGFEPRYTTRDAVREFYAERRLRRVTRTQQAAAWERELHDFLTRKGQERFLASTRGRGPRDL
ncbi:MAG TPA: NAD-dependent epimerase/dehydratase family protein [Actinomycetota bacterium]|nr:NAD-dependent epimerase/dehydratase family protein [Actinomycetota bacterium]